MCQAAAMAASMVESIQEQLNASMSTWTVLYIWHDTYHSNFAIGPYSSLISTVDATLYMGSSA